MNLRNAKYQRDDAPLGGNLPQTLAYRPAPVLPILPAEAVRDAVDRLSPDDCERAFKDRIVPVAWSPDQTDYAASAGLPFERALALGIRPKALIAPNHLVWALQDRFRAGLTNLMLHELVSRFPALSSRQTFTDIQIGIGGCLAALAMTLAVFAPQALQLGISLLFAMLFLAVIGLRWLCLFRPPRGVPPPAAALEEWELPVYSVLVPLFREVAVIEILIPALLDLDYPEDLLDIKIILEEDDHPMRRACAALRLPEHLEILVVPRGAPQTKPRALNYALAFARGKLVTIFDAEDIPEPGQLRLAAAAFAAGPPELACVQASLEFFNPETNWLTRQFTIEYAVLFELLLPCLAAYGLPLPLGGTSNHFRAKILRKVGAWDPFNVTEDADLGLRLSRMGFKTGVIASRTFEEANSRTGNWLKQRARWLKGWAITWLVHMRNPRRLYQDLGLEGFCAAQAILLGTAASALLHPVFLGLTLWSWASGAMFAAPGNPISVAITGASLAILFSGYAITIWAGARALRRIGYRGWWWPLATMPAYWMLISIAAWRALYELLVSPHVWNKTDHGLAGKRRRRRRAIKPARR